MDPEDGWVIHLLETLRAEPPLFDVEAAVARRVRRMPSPRLFAPIVTFRQFSAASSAAVVLLALGAVGLAASLGVSQDGTVRGNLGTALRVFLTTAGSALRGLWWHSFDLLEKLSPGAAWMEGPFSFFWQVSLVGCIASLALTLLIVSHEARGRRLTG